MSFSRRALRQLERHPERFDEIMRSKSPLVHMPLLVHEMMHVWQDHHLPAESISTEAEAARLGVPVDDLYDLPRWVASGLAFSAWPKEAQAEAAAHHWQGLYATPGDGYTRVPEIDRAFAQIRSGSIPL